jgi:hypothetical protein
MDKSKTKGNSKKATSANSKKVSSVKTDRKVIIDASNTKQNVPKYVVFGTSLTRAFDLFKETDTIIYIGKSLRTIEKVKDDIITHLRIYCNNTNDQIIIMNFGNSDTAFTYFLKNLYSDVGIDEYTEYIRHKYEVFLLEVIEVIKTLPGKKKLVLLGTLPPIIDDEHMPKMLRDYLKQCHINPPSEAVINDFFKKSNTWKLESRYRYNKLVNKMLKGVSVKLKISFVDIFDDTVDKNTKRLKEKYIHPFSPSIVHLDWTEYAKLLKTKFSGLTLKS